MGDAAKGGFRREAALESPIRPFAVSVKRRAANCSTPFYIHTLFGAPISSRRC